jgi:hypothetical protein
MPAALTFSECKYVFIICQKMQKQTEHAKKSIKNKKNDAKKKQKNPVKQWTCILPKPTDKRWI